MDDIIEINDSDSNECTITGYQQGTKRKADDDVYFSESSVPSSHSGHSDDDEPILVESSESEPEFDCEDWDTEYKVVDIKPVESSICGFYCATVSEELCVEKTVEKLPFLRDDLNGKKFIDQFKQNWLDGVECKIDGVEIIAEPFKVGVVKNFLQDADVLLKVREEFNEIEWNQRSLDLYEFYQSKDLKYIELPYLKLIYEFLKNDVMKWMSDLTGLELTHISATCSLYSDTDYLLVHDDLREDRVVAYILYLTGKEGWDQKFGGALQLFSKDADGQPLETVKEVWPSNNQFVFFPVSNESYHQVAEVTYKNDCRMSINGWFHCKNAPIYKTPTRKRPEKGLYSNQMVPAEDIDIDLETWISSIYLEGDAIVEIQRQIEDNSEISLRKFFNEEPLEELLANLQYDGLKWEKCGPLNWRNYEVLDESNLPHVLERFLKLFKSKKMFSLLRKYTDLELDKSTSTVRYELQRWKPGYYSLLTDFLEYDWRNKRELDVIMYLGCSRKLSVVGGHTLYVSMEEEIQQSLITLEPEENNLNLIFRDTARITKYVSSHSTCKCFYLLICSYAE